MFLRDKLQLSRPRDWKILFRTAKISFRCSLISDVINGFLHVPYQSSLPFLSFLRPTSIWRRWCFYRDVYCLLPSFFEILRHEGKETKKLRLIMSSMFKNDPKGIAEILLKGWEEIADFKKLAYVEMLAITFIQYPIS